MHHVPTEEVLNKSSLFEEYNEKELNAKLEQLNPFNVIIVFSNS